MEETHIMENIIYNELRNRGFRVDMGIVEAWQQNGGNKQRRQLEVDFVAERGSVRHYIQSAISLPDRDKREQETASLKRIDDSFKRIIITKSTMKPHYDDNGFLFLGLFDFLFNPHLLSEL